MRLRSVPVQRYKRFEKPSVLNVRGWYAGQ
jgi:hypothetical protein